MVSHKVLKNLGAIFNTLCLVQTDVNGDNTAIVALQEAKMQKQEK